MPRTPADHRAAPTPSAPQRPPADGGFALIEVLVSAALLGILALGLLAGIDGPAAISGQNKARAVATALADQDQERLRALKATDLSNLNGSRTVTVANVRYTVESRAVWAADASGTESCTSESDQADYLRIASTVTWPSLNGARPVKSVSVLAPPVGGLGGTRGNLVVRVLDRTGAPVTDLPVSLSPGTLSLATNSQGCAFFGQLTTGSYQATFGRAGWIDPSGVSNVTLNGSVTSGTTSTLATSYGLAATIDVTFDTAVRGAAPRAARAQSVSIVHPSLPPPGTRTVAAGGLQSAFAVTSVFPFTSGYGVYAGSCAPANPTTYQSSYWPANPGFVSLTPGARPAVTVRAPSLNARVFRGSSTYAGAHVVVRNTGSGCSEVATRTSASGGYLTEPEMPFGNYSVCADDGVRRVTRTMANTAAAGSTTVNLTIPTSGTTGLGVCT